MYPRFDKAIYTAARLRLGLGATPYAVALHLGVSENTVRRAFTAKERRQWKLAVKVVQVVRLTEQGALLVKAYYFRTGLVPTARQSGVSTYAMTRSGGYNAIVAAAGLPPFVVGRPRTSLPRSRNPKEMGC